jgi:MoxR-like ATPase
VSFTSAHTSTAAGAAAGGAGGTATGSPAGTTAGSPIGAAAGTDPAGGPAAGQALRPHAEDAFAGELGALAAADDRTRPARWKLSPWAVATYLLGGTLPDGTAITPKYVGPRRIVEVAVTTLATDRALLLLGLPGTAKTWVSEHLAAAISGDSTLLVQGTAGTPEEAIRYGWDYARLLTRGPGPDALVHSPVMRAMAEGRIARVEELTRIPADVQDSLITILSEKTLPIAELGTETQAVRGFNLIATANDRDRGVNELSSALRRRFNTVVLPLPATAEEEVAIVSRRVDQLGRGLDLPAVPRGADEIRRVVTVFRELRGGVTEDGRTKVKSPSGTLSTAEAISVVTGGLALAAHVGDGVLRPADVAAGVRSAVVRDPSADGAAWSEYLEAVVRERPGWADFYRACREVDA